MAEVTGAITTDLKGFESQVKRFADQYGLDARDVMLDQHRLWNNDFIRLTPPKTLAQGRKAVGRDINKLFIPLSSREVLRFFAEEFGTKTSRGGVSAKNTKAAARRNLPGVIFNWDGNPSRIKAWHQKHRRKGSGRVAFRSRPVRTIRDWTFASGMYVPQAKLNKYIRERQRNVGILKAGWIPAANLFGAKIPAFVRRQGKIAGSAQDAMGRDGSGFFLSVNRVPWNRKLESIVKLAGRRRERDIEMNLSKRIQQLADRQKGTT